MGPNQNHPRIWYDSTTNFPVNLPSTPRIRAHNGELSQMLTKPEKVQHYESHGAFDPPTPG